MKLRHLLAVLTLPFLALAARGASTPVNNGVMTGTLAFNQSSTTGLIPWANIGLTSGALPGVNSITAVAGQPLTLTTGALGIQINTNGSLIFPYNATAGLIQSDGSGNITTLANGTNGAVLSMVLGTPTWSFNATGNVSNSGTPSAGQLAQWVDATHIAGVSAINPTSIGATTPGTIAATTLSASSTVSGTGFSTYLASPPAIGGTSPAAGAFTTVSASSTSSFTGVMTISAAVSWGSGVRQTFAPNGTTPGFNVGSNAGDPATPSNGDMWYDSTGHLLRAYVNGSAVSLGSSGVSSITGTAGQVLANGTSGSGQINGVTLTLPAGLTGLTSITALASNNFTITAGSGGNYSVILTPTGSGNVQDTSTTASSSTSTGAFVDSGGMGVAGAIWAGSIQGTPVGSTTTSTGAFTSLSASSTVGGTGFSTYLASPPAIGGTSAAAGAFTTLSASSTVSGTGFSTYLASPPSIGGTSAAAGAFTTLSASSTLGVTGISTLTGQLNANALVNTFGNNAVSSISVGISQNSPTTAANEAILHIGHGDSGSINQNPFIIMQGGNGSGGARTWQMDVNGASAYWEVKDTGGSAGIRANYSGSVGIQFYGYTAGCMFTDSSGNITSQVAGQANQTITPAASALTETTNATTINWATSNTFTLTLNGNLNTVTFSNSLSGQVITVALTNTASNYTVTWGNSIKWVAGSQPVQTVGAHTDVWTIVDLGGTYYGSVVQNF